MTTPSARRCSKVLCDGRLIGRVSFVETGWIEAGDVVDGAALDRVLREHAPDPGRELVAGAPPSDADEGVREARDRPEHEVVVGHEVVVAAVHVLDVADRRVAQPGHALLDEAGDALDAGGAPG